MLKHINSKMIFKLRLLVIASFLCINIVIAATQQQELLALDVQSSMHEAVLDPITPHLIFSDSQKANAWLTDMSNRLSRWVSDDFMRKRYLTIIQYEAARAGFDPQLILSIITVESRFNNYAISKVGARGLMQVMPFWVDQIGTSDQSLFDIQTNLRYGCTILRYYLYQEKGDLNRALARYNGSVGQLWYPQLVMQAYNDYWQSAPVVSLKNGKIVYIDYTH